MKDKTYCTLRNIKYRIYRQGYRYQ